jgi:beta-alanine--pyruvate transaminase
MDAHWMPFTANRAFKRAPRLLVAAEGMHYTADDGRRVLDGTAGLWCVNAGHCRAPIVRAIQQQAATLDFAPGFQMAHPLSFRLAERLAAMLPAPLDRVFFTNSGSEAVDTALKMALAYHAARGEPSRTRFVGRLRGYHGVGFGGVSVGGIEPNRRAFAGTCCRTSSTCRTRTTSRATPSRAGSPPTAPSWPTRSRRRSPSGARRRSPAVVVEPVAGSTACCCRRSATWSGCAPSATGTASC